MERAFSSPSGLRRRRNAFGVVNCCPFLNHPVDFDSRQNGNENKIQIDDRPNGDDSELHRNQGANCTARGERTLMESPNAVICTNNINISSVHNVLTGDHTTINIQTPEQLENITVVYAAIEPEERNTVDAETQISTRPTVTAVTNNINIQDSHIVAIGNIEITSGQTSHPEQTDLNIQIRDQRSVPRVQLFPSPLQLPSAGVESRLARVFDVMCTIVNQLYPLRDRGEWRKFEEALHQLQAEYDGHPEIKCLLLQEESVKLTYQKSLKAAKRKATQCLSITVNEASEISGAVQDVLIVLGNIASASIFRRLPKKLGKAFKCLEDAKESGERLKNVNLTIPEFALALLDYERARCYMAFALAIPKDTKYCNKEACTLLGRCIDRCRKLSYESQLYTARQSFALVYLARLFLPTTNCQSQPGQCERVKKRSARQAEKHLEEYFRSHRDLENSPVAARVKCLMTQSELYFLKRSYALAKDSACQALEIAEKYGFELETAPAQIHLDQMCRHCASTTRQDRLPLVKALPSGNSSSTTTDSDQKYTALTGSQRAM